MNLYWCQCCKKGTTNGTIANFDENFSLRVAPQSVLTFSYIGYVTQQNVF